MSQALDPEALARALAGRHPHLHRLDALSKLFISAVHRLSLSTGPNACYRTKVGCLRICQGGPIAVVYPEGTWYAGLTAERVPPFVQQHLVEGRPVAEWVFARNPLPNPEGEASTGPAPG